MKMLSLSFALLATLSVLVPQNAKARNMMVGLSPFTTAQDTQQSGKEIVRFLAESLEPGEQAHIFDAYNLEMVCTFSVPERESYRHIKAKLSVNGPCIRKVLAFGQGAADTDNQPIVDQAIRIPHFTRFLGENYRGEADVILFGSVLYDDPKEIGTSMAHGHFPSDGHLLAGPARSPFSARQGSNLLEGMRFHIGFPGNEWRLNSVHEHFVRRFWTLFLESQGAELVTFTGDRNVLYSRVNGNAAALPHDYALGTSEKLEMIPVRKDVAARTPIHNRRVSTTPPPVEIIRAASEVEIGISWNCLACDLDLYARPYRGAETLFFGRTNSAEGQFFKDFRQSPELTNGLETIEFRVPVDLADLFLAVNLYAGNAPEEGIEGEIRIAIGEQTYAMAFSMDAASGNRGAGAQHTLATGKAANGAWIVLDPIAVLGRR